MQKKNLNPMRPHQLNIPKEAKNESNMTNNSINNNKATYPNPI